MSANMANSTIHPLWVDKWVVSWTQSFAMRICVVAPPGECLRVKADMVLIAGNTVWSISERVRDDREDALYKWMLPLTLALSLPLLQRCLYELHSWSAVFDNPLRRGGWVKTELETKLRPRLWGMNPILITMKGQERKSIYIAPLYGVSKRSDMDHTVLPANHTLSLIHISSPRD